MCKICKSFDNLWILRGYFGYSVDTVGGLKEPPTPCNTISVMSDVFVIQLILQAQK